ncbi:MAG: protein kinase domain-containing protein [Candidatus Poribacteria bacterium]
MQLLRQSDKTEIIIEPILEIGAGGEARIYALRHDTSYVAKVYHQPTDEKTQKLLVMLSNPPYDPMMAVGHTSIAWPNDLLLSNGKIVGFLMPRVIGMKPIINFYNPGLRRKFSPLFSYLYLNRTARNLASAFRALHESGYVIGDVNESNILVSETSLVTLVDTDSFQVYDPNTGKTYRCPVGRPEFTPPELQSEYFRNIDRKPEHDLFGLAVIIFLLLMEGTHPFAGIYRDSSDPPLYGERIFSGHFTYSTRKKVPYRPAKSAPSFEIIDPILIELFIRCFEDGHKDPSIRPSAQEWQNALQSAERNLITCSINEQHKYGSHLKKCPWCKRTLDLGGRDPFPSIDDVKKGLHLQSNQPKPTKRIIQRPALIVPRTSPTRTTYQFNQNKLKWQRYIRIAMFVAFMLLMINFLSPSTFRVKNYYLQKSYIPSLVGHIESISSLAFSPNGSMIASGSRDSTIKIWDSQTGQLIKTLAGQRNFITSIAFSPDSSSIVCGVEWLEGESTIRGEVRLWNIKQGKIQYTLVGHNGAVSAVAYSPDGKLIATGGTDKKVILWDAQTGKLLNILESHQGVVKSVAFSNNGRFLASASSDQSIHIWNPKTAKSVMSYIRPYPAPVHFVAFSPDDLSLIYVCADRTIRIRDLKTGGLKKMITGNKSEIKSIAFSPNGKFIATGHANKTLKISDIWQGTNETAASLNEEITAIAFSPDSKLLAVGTKNANIRIWNVLDYSSFWEIISQLLFSIKNSDDNT